MKNVTRRVLAFAALVVVAAVAPPLHQAAGAGPEDSQASAARGARVWADNCGRCHNIRDPKDFRSDQWKVIVSHMRLRAGLTGQEARDALKFLQQSSGSAESTQPVSAVAPAARPRAGGGDPIEAGSHVYAQTCIACHGADGKGVVPGAPDLTRRGGPLDKADDVLLKHAEQGFQTPGSPMAMPPKGGNTALSEDDLKAALAYMRKAFRH